MLKIFAITIFAASLCATLSACAPAEDPGYVCMTNCAHQCPDGVSGQECRADMDRQKRDDKDND